MVNKRLIAERNRRRLHIFSSVCAVVSTILFGVVLFAAFGGFKEYVIGG